MGWLFHVKSGLSKFQDFDPEAFTETCLRFMKSEKALLLIGDGMIAGVIYPSWVCPSHLTAQEVFWWSEGNGSLFDAFEAWAKEQGAQTIQMGSIGIRSKALERLYRMRGYAPKEQLFIKAL